MSRKVVSYLLCSLDGVVSDPDRFVFDRFDYEMLAHLKALIDRQDAVLLGRRTYEEWAVYWPTSKDEPFAGFINATRKHVVSRTLGDTSWQGSTLLRGDVAEAVAKLKEAPGRDIGVHGSVTLVQSLLRDDLVDELRLAVFPAVAGGGQRLFEEAGRPQRFDLIGAEQTGKGVLYLTYRPRLVSSRRSD